MPCSPICRPAPSHAASPWHHGASVPTCVCPTWENNTDNLGRAQQVVGTRWPRANLPTLPMDKLQTTKCQADHVQTNQPSSTSSCLGRQQLWSKAHAQSRTAIWCRHMCWIQLPFGLLKFQYQVPQFIGLIKKSVSVHDMMSSCAMVLHSLLSKESRCLKRRHEERYLYRSCNIMSNTTKNTWT
jgi:hypothetical protein